MLHEREFKKPWFEIIDVCDIRGRSLADIAADVCEQHRMPLRELKSSRRYRELILARRDFYATVKRERPDLTSRLVSEFLGQDPSTVRYAWRKEAA